MKIQHVLSLSLLLAISMTSPLRAQELRPELPVSEEEVQDEQQAIDKVTDKVLDPSAPTTFSQPPTVKPQKQAVSDEGAAKHGSNAFGAVGHGAAEGVGAVGHGAAEGVGAVGHGAEAIGRSTVKGAEAVGHGAVKGVESVGHGAKVGVEVVGRGAENIGRETVKGVGAIGHKSADVAENVGTGAVKGAKAVGKVSKEGVEAVGRGAENLGRGALSGARKGLEKIGDLFDHDKPAAANAPAGKTVADNAPASTQAAPAPGGSPLEIQSATPSEAAAPIPTTRPVDRQPGWSN